jgi:hypothetical protein
MIQVGDKYILHSSNGLDYDIEIVNINQFRPIDEIYAIDVYQNDVNVYGDIIFVGDDFINKCTLRRKSNEN